MRVGHTERFNIFDLTRAEILWLHGLVNQQIPLMDETSEMKLFAEELEQSMWQQMNSEET